MARPRISVPIGKVSPILSHGSSSACLRPSEIRLLSASMLRMTTSTPSPFFTTSDGMLDPLGPRHVGDVDQAVDPGLDLDEGAEAGEVPHLAADPGADRVLERQHRPGILLGLLHAERDLLFALVHLEHHGLDGLADAHDLGRVADVPGPAHLGDVHQALRCPAPAPTKAP